MNDEVLGDGASPTIAAPQREQLGSDNGGRLVVSRMSPVANSTSVLRGRFLLPAPAGGRHTGGRAG
ncbi:MAG: hypothetical protein QNJ77_01070 [Acidimicrobiia bacterium]|nr:hypothetical protein [Acidimicrobiia bacterium]